MFDLSGQVAVVTGASSGLGVVFAKALAGQGANIVLLARRQEMLSDVSKTIETMGVRCLAVKADVTDTKSIRDAIDEIGKAFGRTDILVNNAGVVFEAPAEEFPDEQWERVIHTDLSGVFKCSREFADHFMIKQQYGRIINISSMYGLIGSNARTHGMVAPNYAPVIAYIGAKGGVVNLTRGLGAEWAHFGITVNCIAPGYIASGFGKDIERTLPAFKDVMIHNCPMGRQGTEEELMSTVVYLASKESSYTNGVTIPVDGGWSAV
jgi:NAD(P)-dependent dehydrogenase (short-subunit alcohol dehydrogenase family)